MRNYMRHPADIPIEISGLGAPADGTHRMKNIGRGGLACYHNRPFEPGESVRIRIPVVDNAFVCDCVVAWCQENEQGYELGVRFLHEQDAYTARMVAQVCHIEAYRIKMSRARGTPMDSETAAREWIERYAHEFPSLEGD